MPRTKKPQINVQVEPEEMKIFEEIERETGIAPVAIFRAFVRSLIRTYAKNRSVSFPLTLVQELTAVQSEAVATPASELHGAAADLQAAVKAKHIPPPKPLRPQGSLRG